MWLFLLWWCVDDHLASAMNAPGLGELPISAWLSGRRGVDDDANR